ncbi:MAG: B12-binding domain-containing radical SAM protein [Promethearchaeati archaeon]
MPDYPEFKSYGPQANIIFPPLGLEYIASYIIDIADIIILDKRLKNVNLDTIRRTLIEFNPDYVGISFNYTFQIERILEITKLCRKFGFKTVIGGWHPTLAPSETLNYESIDIIVRGEGELTFRELLENGGTIDVLGLSYKINGVQIHNKDREFISMSGSRLPYRSYRDEMKIEYAYLGFPIDYIETSRGCPYSCKFCCIHNFYRRSYRTRSVESIIKELKTPNIKNHAGLIYIVDDNFTVNRKFINQLCDEIIENKINKYFMAQARVDMIVKHPELFKKMADAGFIFLFLGLESFSDRALKMLNKQIKFKQIQLALQILHDLGYIIQGNIIIGADLKEKKQDLESQINITKSLNIDLPTFSLLTPFPGTALMDEVLEKNLLLTNDFRKYNWAEPVIKYPFLTPTDLKYYLSKAYKETLFSKKPFTRILQLIFLRGFRYHLIRLLNFAIIKGLFKFLFSNLHNKDKY